MGLSVAYTNSTNIESLITSSSNGKPNWSYIPTAGKSEKTHSEFVVEIKALAQKAAMAANDTESKYISKQVLQLQAEYLSDVAPDRKQLYQQAKKAMKNQSDNTRSIGSGELTLLDFLEDAEGKNNLADKKIALANGGSLTCPILTSGGYGAEIQYQGVTVLSNLGYGWGYEMTPAELVKKNEFYSIYWDEYHSIKDSAGAELKDLPDYLEDKSMFDRKA